VPEQAETSFRSSGYAKTVRSLGFGAARPAVNCGRGSEAPTLAPSIKKKRPEAPKKLGMNEVSSFFYLPAAITTLFFLAASLLLGLMS